MPPKTLAVLLCLAVTLVQCANYPKPCPGFLKFKNNFYIFERNITIDGIPADINVHFKTGDIYYTIVKPDMTMNVERWHGDGSETIEEFSVQGLGVVRAFQTVNIDNKNDRIYTGTNNGYYQVIIIKDGTVDYKYLGGDDHDIMYLTPIFKDSMLLGTHPGDRMFISTGPKATVKFDVITKGRDLKTDVRNNIYFSIDRTPYVLRFMNRTQNYSSVPITIRKLPRGKLAFFIIDKDGEVYILDEDAKLFFLVNGEFPTFLGTFNQKEVNGFAMDQHKNVYIGVLNAIMKFAAYEKCPEGGKTTTSTTTTTHAPITTTTNSTWRPAVKDPRWRAPVKDKKRDAFLHKRKLALEKKRKEKRDQQTEGVRRKGLRLRSEFLTSTPSKDNLDTDEE
ncbi:uncharacterized protein LOC105385541 [Plutella xylostella]|uniref:uncharacterized protein LOC105385541 n=1 Tax=Plutella xylostella TaxID=51655 RepID=UPI0005D0DFE8|nr:uncharacterized protein LOC105385541 [Plutella xylostella]XP_048488279.1 uncharacterized protein LOC105385541 [Plutella xylostella]